MHQLVIYALDRKTICYPVPFLSGSLTITCCQLCMKKSASKNPERVSSEEPISTLIVDAPLIPNEVPGTVVDTVDNSSFDEVGGSKLANDVPVSSSTKQDGDMPSDPGQPNGSEDIRLEQAATVVQASFRTYQVTDASILMLLCLVEIFVDLELF